MTDAFQFHAEVPDHPDHRCAFCGGRIPAGSEDMVTVTLGDPGGRMAVVWCHRGCLGARVVPRTAARLAAVPPGDYLPSIIARRPRSDPGSGAA